MWGTDAQQRTRQKPLTSLPCSEGKQIIISKTVSRMCCLLDGDSAKKKNEEAWGMKFSRVFKGSLVKKVILEQRLKGGSKGRSQEAV